RTLPTLFGCGFAALGFFHREQWQRNCHLIGTQELHGTREARVAVMNDYIARREPELDGQTVVVIGGSSGIGLETARLARAAGANVILTARNRDRLQTAGHELGAGIAAFDATDFDRLKVFFEELPASIDHVLVTGPGPYYATLAELEVEEDSRDVET